MTPTWARCGTWVLEVTVLDAEPGVSGLAALWRIRLSSALRWRCSHPLGAPTRQGEQVSIEPELGKTQACGPDHAARAHRRRGRAARGQDLLCWSVCPDQRLGRPGFGRCRESPWIRGGGHCLLPEPALQDRRQFHRQQHAFDIALLRCHGTAFRGFDRIIVEDDEAYARNCLYINGTVIVPAGFPRTLERVRGTGVETVVLDMSEFRKLDGGLTCLSLRF